MRAVTMTRSNLGTISKRRDVDDLAIGINQVDFLPDVTKLAPY